MNNQVDMRRIRREAVRWTVLQTLDAARPIGANDQMMMSVLVEVQDNVTMHELHRELDYLSDRKLVEVDKGERLNQWRGKLTPQGIDVVEYTVDCPKGIARPAKYW
jgi:hypothetical protein